MKKKKIIIFSLIALLAITCTFTAQVLALSKVEIKTVKSLTSDEMIDIKHLKTKKVADKKLKIYLDQDNSQYIYSDNKLVGFIKNMNLESQKAKSSQSANLMTNSNINEKLEEYKSIAENIISDLVSFDGAAKLMNNDSNAMNYILTKSDFQTGYEELTYNFAKMIDGYVTNDGITIALDTDGNLVSLNGMRQGMFDKYLDVKIDEQLVNEFVDESMSEIDYPNMETYEVDYQFINIVNDELVLEIGISITLQDELKTSTILYYHI